MNPSFKMKYLIRRFTLQSASEQFQWGTEEKGTWGYWEEGGGGQGHDDDDDDDDDGGDDDDKEKDDADDEYVNLWW